MASRGYGPGLVAVALTALLAAAGWAALGGTGVPAARTHLLLGAGVLPLILGAIVYFVPTLTQTAPPGARALTAPGLGLVAGGLAVAALQVDLRLALVAAPLAALAAGGVLVFARRRGRRALSGPHPGLAWYQAALGCLLAALAAAVAAVLFRAQWVPLRLLHLHLNLLGFVGLTALGTLQVLLPTVGRYPDPEARRRLGLDLWLALPGTVAVAVGAAWPGLRPLAWLGAVAYAVAVGRLALAAARHPALIGLHGAGVSLVGALLGLVAALVVGALQAHVPPRAALLLFGAAFLLPLLTGAMTHLLPVWRWPGPPDPRRDRAHALLGRLALVRTVAFLTAGGLLAAEVPAGGWLAAAAVVAFLVQAAVALGTGARPVPSPG